MIAQSVKKDALLFLGSNMNQGSSKTAKADFGKVMDQRLSNTQKAAVNSGKPIAKEDNLERYDVKNNSVSVDKSSSIKMDDSMNPQELDWSTESLNVVSEVEQNVISEEDLLKMQQLIAEMGLNIATAVQQVLNLSEEELKSVMDQLGMKMTDLLQPDNLKQLILTVNGAEDVSELLTNEKMAMEFSKLTTELENLDLEKELGITKEELVSLVETLSQAAVTQNAIPVDESEPEQLIDQMKTMDASKEPTVEITVEAKNPGDTLSQESSNSLGSKEQSNDNKPANGNMLESFVQNLVGVTTENIDEMSVQASRLNQMKEIVNQVVDKIKILVKPDASSMEIQLNPENLGKVNLTVVAKNGQLTASFVTENQLAKEALENQLQTLKENLSNQGVKVEAIEVTVSNFSFGQSTQAESGNKQQKGTTKKSINLNEFDYMDEELTDEQILAAKVMEQSGGSVDYTA